MDDTHSVWTIWVDQPEHPGKHVIRRYEIPLRGERLPSFETHADNIENARSVLPPGLSKATRSDREDPNLVEIWMEAPWESQQ